MRHMLKIAIASALLYVTGTALPAVAADVSPTLLIESAPSDNAQYRRMVFVKYLQGGRVTASYKAYNRREFVRAPVTTPAAVLQNCAAGKATSLRKIRDFEKSEAKRKRTGQAPEPQSFCIKNIPNWEAKNKDTYLDPIFEGMPYVKGQG